MVILLLVAIVCIIFVIRWFIKRRKIIECLAKFGGPPPLPIIGNMLEFSSRTELLTRISKLNEKYGGMVKLWIGPTPSMLITTDCKFLEFLVNSPKTLAKGEEYKYLEEWIGEGLLTNSGGPRWSKYRKILTPAFHYNVLEQFVPIFTSVCNVLITKLEKEVGNLSYDISNIIKLYTLDIVCECIMGTSVNAMEDPDSQFFASESTICDILVQRTFNPMLKPNILFRFSKQYHALKASVKVLNDVVDTVICKRKAEMKKMDKVTKDDSQHGTKRSRLLLDILLESAEKDPSVTDKHIREEVGTFLFAGHDTSQAAIIFCLYALAENQDIQENLVAELRELLGNDKERALTLQDLKKLKYMDAVIKETLRLYPPVPLHGRTTTEDVEYDGAIIPKGITIVVCTFGLHRDPKLYSNPLKFDPDRFITGGEPKHAYSYLPFSAGMRDCIGKKFAMIEIKLTLASLLRKFEFRPANPKHKLLLTSEVVLKSLSGVRIQIQKRTF